MQSDSNQKRIYLVTWANDFKTGNKLHASSHYLLDDPRKLCDNKEIHDVPMKFEHMAQRLNLVKTNMVVQICLNVKWCQFAFI